MPSKAHANAKSYRTGPSSMSSASSSQKLAQEQNLITRATTSTATTYSVQKEKKIQQTIDM